MALAMKATVETTVAIAAATCQSIDGIMSRHYLREKSEATVFFVVNRNFHFESYFRLALTTVRLQMQSSSPVLSQRHFPPQQWASATARARHADEGCGDRSGWRNTAGDHPAGDGAGGPADG